MRDDVKSLNLRRIEYYTPYSRQVLPTHRKMVRMNPRLMLKKTCYGRLQEQNSIHGNRMVSHWRLPEQNGIINFEQNGIIKEVTIRWRTSKDDDKEVEMKIKRPLSLVFWLTQKGTYQLGLLIDPKSDSSVSKVIQQNQRVTPQSPKQFNNYPAG
jgi:hypothetical protein